LTCIAVLCLTKERLKSRARRLSDRVNGKLSNKQKAHPVKIAYIILAHRYPQQLIRLVNTLYTPSSMFLIHIDKKTDNPQYREMTSGLEHLPNLIFLKRNNCHWGNFGHVRATLTGLTRLVEDQMDFDYCLLLTGQDYPIKSNSYIETFLSNAHERDFVEYCTWPQEWWPDTVDLIRIRRWHFGGIYYDGDPIRVHFRSNKLWKKAIIGTLYWSANLMLSERRIPGHLEVFGGSSYWCLSNKSAKLVHSFVNDNPKFLNLYKYAFTPDETMFQTILLNSSLSHNIINDNLRLIDWSGEIERPRIWRKHDIDTIRKSNAIIARKFDATVDSEILDLIDKELL
jgi:hypothetical protein